MAAGADGGHSWVSGLGVSQQIKLHKMRARYIARVQVRTRAFFAVPQEKLNGIIGR